MDFALCHVNKRLERPLKKESHSGPAGKSEGHNSRLIILRARHRGFSFANRNFQACGGERTRIKGSFGPEPAKGEGEMMWTRSLRIARDFTGVASKMLLSGD
jgi:hypothetical protein